MKRISKVIVALIVFIIPFLSNISMVNAKILDYGDVDENGEINGLDANLVLSLGAGNPNPTPIQEVLADVNFDGYLDASDSIIINQIWRGTYETKLSDEIKGEGIKTGSYEPRYDSTCVAGYGQVDKCITGYEFSNNESGLYSGTDSDGTTYYYRGNVTNNYVQFGTYKEDVTNLTLNNDNNHNDGRTETKVASAGDPILWRIVRINGDGSIRLIAEYNTSATEEAYGTTSNYANSNIKSRIENWYNENIGNDNTLNNKVTMGNYCNDISDNYNGATNRLTQNNPSFICPSGGVEVNSKIGLITADEVKFAGANGTSASDMVVNINTYLNNHTWFWSMTPYQYDIIYTPTPNYGSAGANMESYENNVASDRPVINLVSDVKITSGDGTKDNPYVIGDIADFSDKPVIMNTVNASTENKITSSVLNEAKANQKTLIYETYNTSNDNGKWLYTWTIESNNIVTPKDILTNIEIKNEVTTSDSEEYNKIKYALDGKEAKYLKFDNTANLGSTANISIDISDMNASKVWVYRWDNSTNTIKEVAANQTVTEGKIGFNVSDTTNSNYYIITKETLGGIVDNPQTGMMTFYIIGTTIILVGVGIGYLIYAKKTNKFPKV